MKTYVCESCGEKFRSPRKRRFCPDCAYNRARESARAAAIRFNERKRAGLKVEKAESEDLFPLHKCAGYDGHPCSEMVHAYRCESCWTEWRRQHKDECV